MQKRFLRYLLCVSFLTLALSVVATTCFYYFVFINREKNDLVYITKNTGEALNHTQEDDAYLQNIAQKSLDIRITLIDPDGNVRFDSVEDADTLPSHKDRPEFLRATTSTTIAIERFSHTLSKDLYYVSQRLENGYVLRLSRETDSFFGAFMATIPIDIAIFISIFALAVLVSTRLTTKTFEKLNTEKANLSEIDTTEFPEIRPFIQRIQTQNELIQKSLHKIKRERDTITAILQHMREPLIIIDEHTQSLSINNAARAMFNIRQDESLPTIENILDNKPLVALVRETLQGTGAETVFAHEGRTYKTFISPVFEEGSVRGAVVLFIDETQEIEAKRLREEFSANVSHELKTPLTSICGFSELLSCNMVEESQKPEVFRLIYKDATRLLNLVEDIMKISGLERAQGYSKECISLKDVIDDVLRAQKPLIEEKQLHVYTTGDAELFENKTMVWELFSNLINNGIKYNKDHGSLEIHITKQDKTYEIVVKDTGVGIAPTDLDRIFERFYRADKSRSQRIEGTGLGLSIVKHIVEAMHGTIEVSSKLQVGTTFTLHLIPSHKPAKIELP